MTTELHPGAYRLAPNCKAFVRDGRVIVSPKKSTAIECNRCRDCRHFAYGRATYGGWQHSAICKLRPKTYRYDTEKKNGTIFYATQANKMACDKFEPNTESV